MADQAEKGGSWWLTLPGLLTGAAAVVTAVTGLLLGLHQVGWLGDDGGSGSKEAPPAAARTAPTTPAATVSAEANAGVGVPAGEQLAVDLPLNRSYKSGTVAYSVTGATAEPDVDNQLRLSFTIHAVNSGRYDLNFWDRSFRVVAGAESYAPTSGLDDIVHGDATGTGTVEFVIPAAVTEAKLVFRYVEGERTVPFTISGQAN
jgi:hypothetical protein